MRPHGNGPCEKIYADFPQYVGIIMPKEADFPFLPTDEVKRRVSVWVPRRMSSLNQDVGDRNVNHQDNWVDDIGWFVPPEK